MRSAVEAVLLHSLLAPLAGHSVAYSVLRHGGVELRFKRCHERHAGHGFLESANAGEVDGVVGGRRGKEFLERGDDAIVNDEGAAIARAGVHGFERHRVHLGIGDDGANGFAIVRDAFLTALADGLGGRHFNELILQRSGAEVGYEDVHLSPYCWRMTWAFFWACPWKGLLMAAHCVLNFSASAIRRLSFLGSPIL